MKKTNVAENKFQTIEEQSIFWGEMLIATAIDVEVELFLAKQTPELVNGKKRLVRNGFLPPRVLRTSYGALKIVNAKALNLILS